MKQQHVQMIFKNLFYANCKKYYCADCGEILRKTKLSRIINSNSPKAKDSGFHTVDNYMIGDVKFS